MNLNSAEAFVNYSRGYEYAEFIVEKLCHLIPSIILVSLTSVRIEPQA